MASTTERRESLELAQQIADKLTDMTGDEYRVNEMMRCKGIYIEQG